MSPDIWASLFCIFGLLTILGTTSGVVNERLWVSEPLTCVLAGIAIGPVGLGLLHLDAGADPHSALFLQEAARITLAIAVTGAAMRLPADWLRENWRGLAIPLGPGMLLMWGVGSLVASVTLGLSWLPSLLLGAALAPTDPVLSAPILTGRLARNAVPEDLRHGLTAESGINDGLAMPLVLLPVLLLSGQDPGRAWIEWVLRVVIWEVGIALVVGGLAGWVALRCLRWARSCPEADSASLLSVTIVLALTVLSGVRLLGGDGVLGAFVAGAVLNVGHRENNVALQQERFSEAIGRFFDLPIMILFGVALPWSAWTDLGWPVAAFAAGILLLRRMPAWMLLRPKMPWTPRKQDALFAGWFGPVGAAAVFYGLLIQQETELAIVWPAISLAVFASVVAHGVTGTPLTRLFGRSHPLAGKHRE